MSAFKKYITGLLAAVFMAASIGVPIEIYRCSIGGKLQTVNCCPEKAAQPYGGSIKALPCMSAINSAPIKAIATPNTHKAYTPQITVTALLSVQTSGASFSSITSLRQDPKKCLPPPLLLSHTLLI